MYDGAAWEKMYQTARKYWKINQLRSRVLVTVTVTDERYLVPENKGLRHMQFVVRYVQDQKTNFDGNFVKGEEYPDWRYSWVSGSG
jgi:hypothetical protein